MQRTIFKPLVDKTFWIISVSTLLLMTAMTVISAFAPIALLITVPIDIVVVYLLVSPLFGYVELRENAVFVKLGLILKREIPYGSIRDLCEEKKLYADSMISLKCALRHVNIKYNRFDIMSVSVRESGALIDAIKGRIPK